MDGAHSDSLKDFFVSYNKADKNWAEWIAWEIEQAGYTTIIQAWDFRPGNNFVLEMQRGATLAKKTIAVLSPEYLKAMYTQPEWASAFSRDPTGVKKLLIPVRVSPCQLEGLLAQIIYIELVGVSPEEAKAILLSGVRDERVKPATAPAFPGVVATSSQQAKQVAPQAPSTNLKEYVTIEELFDVETVFMDSHLPSIVHVDLRAKGAKIDNPLKCEVQISIKDLKQVSHIELKKQLELSYEWKRLRLRFAYGIPPVNSTKTQAVINIRVFPDKNAPYDLAQNYYGSSFYGNTYYLSDGQQRPVIVERIAKLDWM